MILQGKVGRITSIDLNWYIDTNHGSSYFRHWNHRTGDAEVKNDHLDLDEARKAIFTGYRTDACIFDSEIKIDDTYTATIRYDKGAMLSYSVTSQPPGRAIGWASTGLRVV